MDAKEEIDPLITVMEQLLAEHGVTINGDLPTRRQTIDIMRDIIQTVTEFKKQRAALK